MPVQEICVCPSAEKKDKTSNDNNDNKAMLQSIVSTYPSMQNGSSPPLSSPSATCDICRICHCESEPDSPLIAPCICSGSLRYVHQACLQQWIKSSNTRKCELCKFEFIMQTKIKPFSQWEKLQMSSVERRKIFCSVTFHFVAITCVVWSLYVLIDRTADEVQAGLLEWPFWTKLIVVAIGFSGGLVVMYVQCKLYVQLCRRWKAFNRIIYVQNAPPKAISAAVQNNSSATSAAHHPNSNTTVSVCLEPMSTSMTSAKGETHSIMEMTPSGATVASAEKKHVTLSLSPVSSPSSDVLVSSSKELSIISDPDEDRIKEDVGMTATTVVTIPSEDDDDVTDVTLSNEPVQRLT